MDTTKHHCDTCTCRPAPDLMATLLVAASLDLHGAYNVAVTPDVIDVQGDRSDVEPIIERLGAAWSGSNTSGGSDYVVHAATAHGIRVRITAVERNAVTA